MSHKILYPFVGSILLFFGSAKAQTTTYAGVVKDSISGLGLGGMAVKVIGTALETFTAGDGSYTIPNAPRNSPLLFGGTNYATKIVAACVAKPGDVNSSGGTPNLQDVIYVVNFVFDKSRISPPCNGTDPGNCWTPDPLCRGDVNGSGGTPNLQDVIYLVNFVFDKSRISPPCNGTDPGNCWTPVASGSCCLP